jgi:hypothetical protein
MRIAIDIDSTLHHYWDRLSDAARRRFGVDLPYEEQFTWGITRLRPEQLECVIGETHKDAAILAGRPYPGAVDVVNRWHAAGHFIHITSHRDGGCQQVTEQWLDAIGLHYDELYCSYDKVARCCEIGIDLLIDDSPVNLQGAIERGISAATILHPWNQDVVEEEGVVAAGDWPTLADRLEHAMAPLRRRASAA